MNMSLNTKKVSNKLMENCEILKNYLNYKNIRP